MKFTQKLESIPFLLCPLFLSVEQNDSAIPENRFRDTTEHILHVISQVARFCFVALEEAIV